MNRFAAAAFLAAFATISAAQAASPGSDAVGDWVYSASGAPIGSLRAIEGDQATVMLGNYTWPGGHLVRVRISVLSEANGRVTVSGDSEVALRSLPPYRG